MIKIFLSYAHEDFETAKKVYEVLNSYPSFDVWFDKESLLPGQKWEMEIKNAIKNSRYFLILISAQSSTKKGFVQREIREALRTLEEYPDEDVYIIPARLDESKFHFEQLKALHYVDLFPNLISGLDKIVKTVRQHEKIKSSSNVLSESSNIRIRCHQAAFTQDPYNLFYFVSITNLMQHPIEITHVWYEDVNKYIEIKNGSRATPKRLDQSEVWVTWLNIRNIPDEFRHNAYDKFRVRLSTGEIFDSEKEDSMPPRGSVPGGEIFSKDME